MDLNDKGLGCDFNYFFLSTCQFSYQAIDQKRNQNRED